MILKATKKPVTIECVKWDGKNVDEIKSFCKDCKFELDTHAYDAGIAPPRWNLTIHTLEGDLFALEGDYIIKGVNGEIYPCKPDIFEKTYDVAEKPDSVMEAPETTHGFDWAIQRLNAGEKVQRKGWNGKGQYIELATSISYKNAKGEIINCNHDAIGNKALAFVGTSGVQMGWLASQADMLAEDWMIAE